MIDFIRIDLDAARANGEKTTLDIDHQTLSSGCFEINPSFIMTFQRIDRTKLIFRMSDGKVITVNHPSLILLKQMGINK